VRASIDGQADPMTDVLWPCGILSRAHGLHGEIYLKLLPHGLDYLSSGEEFFLVSEGGVEPSPVRVSRAGGDDRRPLLRVEGVESREQAAALSGSLLAAAGGELDAAPAWRVGDLIGLRADCGVRDLGVVTDVLQAPASDVLQIEAPGSPPVLVPLVDELVQVDLDAGVLHVREGLL
jgi:ribosomal 30S subunit maturation factor RimM